uniref:Capsule gland specific secretory protein n=1 Tax=Reishia bronni TaxID=578817 RepID=A0A6G9KPB2_9CAEN|nr:capsule gland specific secretory protein [Reishia bronni]
MKVIVSLLVVLLVLEAVFALDFSFGRRKRRVSKKKDEKHPRFKPHPFTPHSKPIHPFISKPHPFRSKSFSLGNIPHQLRKILEGTGKGIRLSKDILGIQGKTASLVDQARGNQGEISKRVAEAGKNVKAVLSNSRAILAGQGQILKGQGAIRALVSAEHAATRKAVLKLQNNAQAEISKIFKNQGTILDKIEQGRAKALAGFDKLFRSKATTQSRLQVLIRAINDASSANLEGQAGIIDAIQDSQQEVQNDLAKVFGRQLGILKSLDQSQKSVEKRIDTVFDRQNVIINSIKRSQSAVQSDLAGLRQEQGKTQVQVKQSEAAVRRDIAEIKKHESFTQHILVKCEGDCPVGKSLNGIAHLKKQLVNIENNFQREVRAILSSEAKTQGAVKGAEQTFLREVTTNSDDTLAELKGLAKKMDTLLHQCEADIKRFNKDVVVIEKVQETIEHALKKILQDLEGLHFGGVQKFSGF